MKDYRTWWRKGLEVWESLGVDETGLTFDEIVNINNNDWDCISEQIWAIRENLA